MPAVRKLLRCALCAAVQITYWPGFETGFETIFPRLVLFNVKPGVFAGGMGGRSPSIEMAGNTGN